MNERSSGASRALNAGMKMKGSFMRLLVMGLALLSLSGVTPGAGNPRSLPTTATSREKWAKLYRNLPVSFELNKGQTDHQVKYLARGAGYTVFFTSNEAVLALHSPAALGQSGSAASSVVRLKLLGANRNVAVKGEDTLPGQSNYFLGKDARHWYTRIPNYGKVRYRSLYPGVDLVYYGREGELEYDFQVAPGADPRAIALDVETGESKFETRKSKLEIAANGDVVIDTGGGKVQFHKPVIYQPSALANGSRNSEFSIQNSKFLDGRYVLTSDNRIRFEIPNYDKTRPLVIDPVLTYSTYLGATGGDVAYGIAVDGSDNAYITGITNSGSFPTMTPKQGTYGGSGDAFITKLNPTGTALVYSTYLGGSGADTGTAIAVDASGDAFVTGSTASTDFPTTTGAFQSVYGGNTDAFVTELSSTGSSLVYSSYLGGTSADSGQGIAVDSTGSAYVTGSTQSIDFPTVTPVQTTNAGASDAFVAKMNFAGTALVYSTYLGGAQADVGQAIKVDSSGDAFITGYTFSLNFPTAAALQGTNAGPPDAFVAELNPAGSALTFSTYLGGTGDDRGFGLALDSTGNIYVTGASLSTDFPTTSTASQIANAGQSDAFVTKYNPTASAYLYSTLLGGGGIDQGNGIAVDSSGDAFVAGFTRSGNFPTANPVQGSLGLTGGGSCGLAACADAFVSELNPTGSGLVSSTYLGGSGDDFGQAIALDSAGNAFVAGSTSSTNFPAIAGAYQGSLKGTAGNAFVAEVSPTNAPAIAIMPQSVNFGNQTLSVRSAAQTITVADLGTQDLSITAITSSNTDFTETDNCIGTITAGGGHCAINVTFTPAATGSATGTLTITDNASGSPHTINLSGTGVTAATAVTLAPTSLSFGNQTVGTVSAAQTVTITNTGTSTLSITSISATGDYTATNDCSSSFNNLLNVGQSCSVSVSFAPTATGGRNGTLSVNDNATGSPQVVALSGIGLANFSLSSSTPTTIVAIGSTTATIPVSAASPSGFTGNITLVCLSGATCTFNPTTIVAGQSSTLTLSNLSASTPNPFNFTVGGSSGSQTATLSLTLLFADYALSSTPSLNTIVSGQSATYTIIVTPSNGFSQQVNLACTNLPVDATCSFSAASVSPHGGAASVTLTISTVKSTSSVLKRWLPPRGGPPPAWLLLVGMAGLWSLIRLHRYYHARGESLLRVPLWSKAVSCGLALVLLALLAGCRPASTTTTTGTTTGNYFITVTGTLNSNTSVVRSVVINLAVT